MMGEPGSCDFSVSTTWPCSNLRLDTLQLTWCNQPTIWKVFSDISRPGLSPDVVLNDPAFCPAIFSSCGSSSLQPEEQQLSDLLVNWSSSNHPLQLTKLVQLLTQLYKLHNQIKLVALTDDRVHFELGTLDVTGCDQLLYIDARDPKDRRACFSIPLVIPDLQQLAASLLTYQQQGHSNNGSTGSSSGSAPGAEAHGSATCSSNGGSSSTSDGFRLTASFRVGPGNSHIPPELHLQSPTWFKAGLPPFSPPSWNLQAPLMEYVPHLVERLSQHISTHAAAAALRYQLFEALAGLLGPPLEVCIPAASTTNSSSSSTTGLASSSSSSTVSSTGKAGSAVFHLNFSQQPLLLFVELGQRFPEELPLLMVQSLRRPGPEGCRTFTSLPWSPRWTAAEMAARLFNFLKQQLASCAEQLLGTGSSGTAAGGSSSSGGAVVG